MASEKQESVIVSEHKETHKKDDSMDVLQFFLRFPVELQLDIRDLWLPTTIHHNMYYRSDDPHESKQQYYQYKYDEEIIMRQSWDVVPSTSPTSSLKIRSLKSQISDAIPEFLEIKFELNSDLDLYPAGPIMTKFSYVNFKKDVFHFPYPREEGFLCILHQHQLVNEHWYRRIEQLALYSDPVHQLTDKDGKVLAQLSALKTVYLLGEDDLLERAGPEMYHELTTALLRDVNPLESKGFYSFDRITSLYETLEMSPPLSNLLRHRAQRRLQLENLAARLREILADRSSEIDIQLVEDVFGYLR
ncbi:hypothetical protein GGR54DRAFT_223708 [Hypoxylon sp. NC1633]|nr:hypothetical protein GGR54DRAFT_223708 [Hypoxylon sp. NC1633]